MAKPPVLQPNFALLSLHDDTICTLEQKLIKPQKPAVQGRKGGHVLSLTNNLVFNSMEDTTATLTLARNEIRRAYGSLKTALTN